MSYAKQYLKETTRVIAVIDETAIDRVSTLLGGMPAEKSSRLDGANHGRRAYPRQCVGAAGAVFDDGGRALLVEHVLRTDSPWGLPGGWVERGEDPSDAAKRENQEELKVHVDLKELLFSLQVGLVQKSTHPCHIG